MTTLESVEEAPTTHASPDFDQAIDFLRKMRPAGFWVLTAIEKEGKKTKYIETRTFRPEEWATCVDWLGHHHDCRRHLYWTVNPTMRELGGRGVKAGRAHIQEMAFLHVDIDPRAGEDVASEQERIAALFTTLPQGLPPPTVIVFSGGGYQAFWRLTTPVPIEGEAEAYEEAKRYNQQLEYLFGGDNCHNVDRIMRLPGTINWKATNGRQPTRAELVAWNEVSYPVERFTMMPPLRGEKPKAAPPDEVRRTEDLSELRREYGVMNDVLVAINYGHDPENKERFPSRSEWLFYVTCNLKRCKVPDGVILGIITDEAYGISESVLEQSNPERYALRQIERATQATREFILGKNKTPIANHPDNVRIALEQLGVTVKHDIFQDRSLIEGLDGEGPYLDDHAVRRLRMLIGERCGFLPEKELFFDVVVDLARQNKVHPVREYLDELRWDGIERIDRWLQTYAGAEDNEFNRVVGALWLQAAVRRIRRPGCKFDEMPVLEAGQGEGKSTALRILAVKDEWFLDDFPLGLDGKRVIEATQGKWIIEAAELHGMSTAKVEQLKSSLSRQEDQGRLSYAKLTTIVARQFVVAGTTNSSQYLTDPTGNRRFWPVTVQKFKLDDLRRDRDQLWAEAAVREARGESIHLPPPLWPKAAVVQKIRVEVHPFVHIFEAELSQFPTGKFPCAHAFTILGLGPAQMTQANQAHIGASLRSLGWERRRLRVRKANTWCYVKGKNPRLIEVYRAVDGTGLSMSYEDPDKRYVDDDKPEEPF
ncbi:VapE domain-containing protein [Bradyrhizobium sp. PMVTL-01]|uniref:VapE domain-containing protein n=1 Tax=Bradyrhizobium sp. PMVTL-01 TaxID=3434999 RepID=UPI003F72AC9A